MIFVTNVNSKFRDCVAIVINNWCINKFLALSTGCLQGVCIVNWVLAKCMYCQMGAVKVHSLSTGCLQNACTVNWVLAKCTHCQLGVVKVHSQCLQNAYIVNWVLAKCIHCQLEVDKMLTLAIG